MKCSDVIWWANKLLHPFVRSNVLTAAYQYTQLDQGMIYMKTQHVVFYYLLFLFLLFLLLILAKPRV